MDVFYEYIVLSEMRQKEMTDAWQTAIGHQDVDGLKDSTYLLGTARKNIEGAIPIDETSECIKAYYETKSRINHNIIQNTRYTEFFDN